MCEGHFIVIYLCAYLVISYEACDRTMLTARRNIEECVSEHWSVCPALQFTSPKDKHQPRVHTCSCVRRSSSGARTYVCVSAHGEVGEQPQAAHAVFR